MITPTVVVFSGGTSSEREVSLGSGRACALALARSYPTRLVDVRAEALPADFDPAAEVVFSVLHGTFGEDGGMQSLLDAAGAHYGGCGAAASALTLDKSRTKATAAARGVPVIDGVAFEASAAPTAADLYARLGPRLVLKPNAEGSSVGLHLIDDLAGLVAALGPIVGAGRGAWLAERRIEGREFSVGVLGARAMGIVEIRPRAGVYDYASKYTPGMTEYLAPAPLEAATALALQRAAETAFAACGCRDYARVDFMLSRAGELFLLEINTLPGMKETSLLPMSARCVGLDFTALVREMIAPALQRFFAAAASRPS